MDDPKTCDQVCELNVVEQVPNVCHPIMARDAQDRDQDLGIQGGSTICETGARERHITAARFEEEAEGYRKVLASFFAKMRSGGSTDENMLRQKPDGAYQ